MVFMKCENCNLEHDGTYGSGRFCSNKCARGFSTKNKRNEINKKVSKKLKGRNDYSWNKNPELYIYKLCPICNTKFNSLKSRNQIHCSPKCVRKNPEYRKKISEAMKKNPNAGGFRKGSGRGKNGWYKNYWCDSSWELAWVIYNLDHNIKFQRNTQGFIYIFKNKKHLYYPDFILEDGTYVEIKGIMNERNKAKFEHFKNHLLILKKKEMLPYLEYVNVNYGNDFIRLYEDNPHNKRLNECEICGEPAIKKLCSRKCAGIHLGKFS